MKFISKKVTAICLTAFLSLSLLAGCAPAQPTEGTPPTEGETPPATEVALSGEIAIDGSSTVYPITSAVAEEFQKLHQDLRITVGFSGTGGGFEKFIAGETDINNASRYIKDEEKTSLDENGIAYKELEVAFDGLSVVVNHANDFVDYLTVDELKKMWEPSSTVMTWQDVRPEWPAEEIKFFSPGADSGTFDYFTEEVVGESGAIRTDITASEDDNVLVTGVAGEETAIGFFGYAYYQENKEALKIVPIDSGSGPIEPNDQTIMDGTYTPLSRPLLIYVREDALEKEEVKAFVTYYLTEGIALVPQVGYVSLPDENYAATLESLN